MPAKRPARAVLLLIASVGLTFGTAAAAGPADGADVILDQDGYFRIAYKFGMIRIDAEALRTEGPTLLSKSWMRRLEKETRRHLKDRAIDWKTADWRDHACTHFVRTQLGDDTRAAEMIPTVDPPASWMQTDFDDAAWLHQHLGRLPAQRNRKEAYDFSSLLVRTAYLRTYFHVPDPQAAGELALSLTYRGGARVLVNGAEVARGDLGDGELAADMPGRGYPRAAYLARAEEWPYNGAGVVGDIRGEYEHGTPGEQRNQRFKGYRLAASGHPLTRAGWNRLRGLRDRKLAGVRIPAKLLRKGRNCLAIEVRGAHFHPQILRGAGGSTATNWARHGGTENHTWDHCRLLSIRLTGGGGRIPSCVRRPAGVQVWAEDMHRRLFDRDFVPPGAPVGTVRIIAAINGEFSGLAVAGTDRKLTGFRATVGDLKRADTAAVIPAAAVRVAYLKGHSILQLARLGHERCLNLHHWNCGMATSAVARYDVRLVNPPKDGRARQAAQQKLLSEFKFFDHIAARAPQAVPADSIQPVWITLKVPPDAKPGRYRGQLAIEADGIEPLSVPVEVELLGWRLPDPRQFQTVVESEQSPYGVAKAYGCKLWSAEHWRLMDASFRQLARLGADWLFVPVLLNTEFGNRGDASMIRWIRARDGALRFDYAILDRYLDLAIRHWGRPRVVSFVIMHGVGSATNHVRILDESTHEAELVDVGPKAIGVRRPLWRAFATSLREHMRRRGLEEAMHWGHAFDRVYDPGLVTLMREFAPGIFWSAGAHGRAPDATFRAVARAYGSDMTETSMEGWRNPYVHLVMPRTNGSVICVEGTSTPFPYRVLVDRGIYAGFNGIGRMGADYFGGAWWDGFQGGEYLLVGRSCVLTLWPGPDGAESSTRNEAMREGVQEAEARIFIEQALARDLLDAATAARVRRVLDDHFRATLHIPGGAPALTMMEYTGDWQARSRRLFATAAEVAEIVGLDVDTSEIGTRGIVATYYGITRRGHGENGVPLPADGHATVRLRLRNWNGSPRAWRAAAEAPWIRPRKTEGKLLGQEDLEIQLDGKGRTVGEMIAGTLTVTDAAGGRSMPVRITARIVKPFELRVNRTVFNIAVGGDARHDYLLTNRTDRRQPWRIDSSAPWVAASPASGSLEPGGSAFVLVTLRPPDRNAAVHRPTLTLHAGGAERERVTLKTFVIPPYKPPAALPAGAAVPLETVSKTLLLRHRSVGWFRPSEVYRSPTFGPTLNVWHGHQPAMIGEKHYRVALWIKPAHETVYTLEGTDYTGFAAEVGFNRMVTRSRLGRGWQTVKLSFEVHVDGRPVAQSGLMLADEPARRLVATWPKGAKELKLVTRTQHDADGPLGLAYGNWGEPTLYRRK